MTSVLKKQSVLRKKTAPVDHAKMSLQMDYWPEQLSETQKAFYNKAEKEYNDIMARVSNFITNEMGSVCESGSDVLVLQGPPVPTPIATSLNSISTPVSQHLGALHKTRLYPIQTPPSQQVSAIQAASSQQLVIQNASVPSGARVARTTQATAAGTIQTPQGTIQLVVDPRIGLYGTALWNNPSSGIVQSGSVPQIPTMSVSQSSAPVIGKVVHTGPVSQVQAGSLAQSSGKVVHTGSLQHTSISQLPISIQPAIVSSVSVQPALAKGRAVPAPSRSAVTDTTPSAQATGSLPSTGRTAAPPKTKGKSSGTPVGALAQTTIPTSATKPTENNSVGGLSAGTSGKKQDEVKTNASGPDSREIAFNKHSGKTFPSLVVSARPHLRIRDIAQSKQTHDRSSLDSKVKCVLMYTSTKFSEWLIQQEIVRTEQYCEIHTGKDGGPLKMKLGMYSDVSKFPYSGGYVWISECCPNKYVSLFSGSIFESAPHPPSVLLKLMYHWCCQTNVQNVIQWVKVDNIYVKSFFTFMRSICIAAVHEKHEKLGGPQKKVEVGVISLGTTSQDGNMRQVKVEVLGVMDSESKLVRLKAVEPLQDGERNYKRRFLKILEPLRHWVHKDSVIVTDFTVDKGTLLGMGFSQVHQSNIPDPPNQTAKLSNQNIMEYLRRIVPRMFQSTLSLLSRQIIQQFLDELVWRERWGPVPSQAFDSLVSHLASETKLDTGDSLVCKLNKIAANPFRDWAFKHWKYDGYVAPEPILEPVSGAQHRVAEMMTRRSPSEEEECQPSIAVTKKFEYKISAEMENQLLVAIQKIDQGSSLRNAVKSSKVPRFLLLERATDVLKKKVNPGTPFTDDEEADIKEHLMTLHDWGYPFGRWDLRLVVKQYLDACGRSEPRFKENFPGDMWIEKYLYRHPIVAEKLCRNIPSRGTFVDMEAVKRYILNLSLVIPTVQPENVMNFMEIGLTGDPLKSMVLELRDLRYPVGKRKAKSSAAVMIACTAAGKVLPSYIIFEGKRNIMGTGKFAGEYYGSKTGWFDETAFQYWLESVVFPWADNLPGKKVLIGDNLAQLFTVKTLAHCEEKKITFVSMPCNVSKVLSPLDVVLCEKLKTQWRTQCRLWASSNSDKIITPEEFPTRIYELLRSTLKQDMPEHLRTSFKHVGLYPFNTRSVMNALEKGGLPLNDNSQDKGNKKKKPSTESDDVSTKRKTTIESSVIEEVVIDDDHEKQLNHVGSELKNNTQLTKLETYYYGTKKPVNSELDYKVENLSTRCPYCQTHIADNITLMRHLMAHPDSSYSGQEWPSMCRYCTTTFSDSEELEKHITELHTGMSSPNNFCLICSEKMASREALILHMQSTHHKLELPYVCNVCLFRSSEHYKVVEHFYETHAGGEKIQCPYCLKCVPIINMGKKLPSNVFFFMHHVKNHQASKSSVKCEKCSLRFLRKDVLKEHMNADHFSLHDDPGKSNSCVFNTRQKCHSLN
ncbi:hypothetical protein ONE63_008271 [Megalurothrips usitatus]|uniref:C2H2-type domain-containing protein n=1 Tax=Megalurothrips usitatus TaxID=439358 RepID=A0AAV7XKM4_9NEOP|nr:hypothetical protein ONE63_008271 [Megalurothrips usitatus]